MMRLLLLVGLGVLGVSLSSWSQTVPLERPPHLVASELPNRGPGLSDLQRLVFIALERSPLMKEAQANWRASLQDVEEAKAALYPRVEFNANTAGNRLEGGQAPTVNARAGAAVNYNLVDFGKTRNAISAREFQSSAYLGKMQQAREQAVYETVMAYLQLVKFQRLMGVYRQHIGDLESLVGKLAEIVAVFPGRRSELTQARTRLAQARDSLLAMEARKREAQLTLLRQVGAGQVSDVKADALPSFEGDDLARLLEIAESRHPSVITARAESESARATLAEARASHRPQIDLQLTKQTGRDEAGTSSPAQVFVAARWNAFQGFGDKANEQALLERAAAAEERVGQSLIEVDFKIRSAKSEADALAGRLREHEGLVASTDQVRKDYFVQWRDLGRRSLLDVLTAENEHLNTVLNHRGSEVDHALALARMRFEAGFLKEWLVGDDGRVAEAASVPARAAAPAPAPAAVPAPAPAPAPATPPSPSTAAERTVIVDVTGFDLDVADAPPVAVSAQVAAAGRSTATTTTTATATVAATTSVTPVPVSAPAAAPLMALNTVSSFPSDRAIGVWQTRRDAGWTEPPRPPAPAPAAAMAPWQAPRHHDPLPSDDRALLDRPGASSSSPWGRP